MLTKIQAIMEMNWRNVSIVKGKVVQEIALAFRELNKFWLHVNEFRNINLQGATKMNYNQSFAALIKFGLYVWLAIFSKITHNDMTVIQIYGW